MHTAAQLLKNELLQIATKGKAKSSARFFKTGVSGYAAEDIFIGVTVPEQRIVAKKYRDAPFSELKKLLHTDVHEYRLTALCILLLQYEKGNDEDKKQIFDFAMGEIKWINNWDLVDTVARDIFGAYVFTLLHKKERKVFFDACIVSQNMWHQRIGVVATHYQIKKQKSSEYVVYVCEKLLHHKHDLIHKAMGWMLREMGKECGKDTLLAFLKKHYGELPRTTLRYAIEHFEQPKRKQLLQGEF